MHVLNARGGLLTQARIVSKWPFLGNFRYYKESNVQL